MQTVPIMVWLLVAPWLVAALVRVLGMERGWVLVCAVAFTPYAALSSPVPLLVALVTRQWGATAAAGTAMLALVAAVLPRAFGRPETGPGPRLRVLTANLLLGRCDPDGLISLVRERQVDVLAIQEYPTDADEKLRDPLTELLPVRRVEPATGGKGSVLYSRYPLRDAGSGTYPGGHRGTYGTVEPPGAAAVEVTSVHPASPYTRRMVPFWRAGLAGLAPADPRGPVRVLLGDFNATLDHDPLRTLLRAGYRDAALVVGRGLVPTWPYTAYGRLPRVTLDHVLADRRIRVAAVAVTRLSGTDHRAVYAELVLPAATGDSRLSP